MLRLRHIIPCILMILLLASCAAQQPSSGADYKEIKSMVIDILKTEEGKKAIEEAQKSSEQSSGAIMQMLSSPQGQQIQMAVKEVLTDPKYPEYLKQMMTDPKFAGEFAKAVQEANKDIHKQLMTDPEYQSLLIDIMKQEDFKKIIMEVMKGKEYRQQTMTIMQEAIENPLFRLELMELLKKAMEEESKSKEEQKG
ncbi:germination protein GerD [Insulibacter thermoxylanivorax]|uniref:Germination protein GerD n=1 Tax=Insulibacter thermoxylanivorax TaxID=2749268 RepID=A0A916QJ42_9BACL|nr:spore germination lipoprotein GerD [Insulibacter thermoxylanivorax]GFR39447.1 germination protein GerD [Insulibacter thermoxylanivorax]